LRVSIYAHADPGASYTLPNSFSPESHFEHCAFIPLDDSAKLVMQCLCFRSKECRITTINHIPSCHCVAKRGAYQGHNGIVRVCLTSRGQERFLSNDESFVPLWLYHWLKAHAQAGNMTWSRYWQARERLELLHEYAQFLGFVVTSGPSSLYKPNTLDVEPVSPVHLSFSSPERPLRRRTLSTAVCSPSSVVVIRPPPRSRRHSVSSASCSDVSSLPPSPAYVTKRLLSINSPYHPDNHGPWKCHVESCLSDFLSRGALELHIRTTHHTCSTCEDYFSSAIIALEHREHVCH